MLQELLEFVKQNALIWFNSLGALIAFVLGIFKILEFKRKRVSLSINLEQDNFVSRRIENPGTYEDVTIIDINVDLRNTGLEPTSLVGVDFYSDNELLSNLKMTTSANYTQIGVFRTFDEIRIEHNDRKIFKLTVSKGVLLPNDVKELKAKLVFKITHKDISKKIKLVRKKI